MAELSKNAVDFTYFTCEISHMLNFTCELMDPCHFFKCLADETRLKSLLLIAKTNEACVCDLMEALQLDQPKTSRHLAQLRKCGILVDERRGKWVFYKLHPALPKWARDVIINAAEHNNIYFESALKKLIASKSSSITCC